MSNARDFVDAIYPRQQTFDFGFDYGLAVKSCGIQVADNGLVIGELHYGKLTCLMKLVAACAVSAIKLDGPADYERLNEFISSNRLLDDVGAVREEFLVERLKEYFHLS